MHQRMIRLVTCAVALAGTLGVAALTQPAVAAAASLGFRIYNESSNTLVVTGATAGNGRNPYSTCPPVKDNECWEGRPIDGAVQKRLSCPFGGDRRDRGAKKALLLGGFQHDNRLSELVRFLRGGASGGVDEVAEPRAARQAAGAVGVARGKVQACRTCGRLTRASAPLSDNDRRPGAGTACTASGSECSRFTPK